jgi:hypothetical protein
MKYTCSIFKKSKELIEELSGCHMSAPYTTIPISLVSLDMLKSEDNSDDKED